MQNFFSIDPGIDSEIKEIEEYTNRRKAVKVELKVNISLIS
jgi:hypothetical protein